MIKSVDEVVFKYRRHKKRSRLTLDLVSSKGNNYHKKPSSSSIHSFLDHYDHYDYKRPNIYFLYFPVNICWRQGTTRGSTLEMNLFTISSCCLESTMKGRSSRERTQILKRTGTLTQWSYCLWRDNISILGFLFKPNHPTTFTTVQWRHIPHYQFLHWPWHFPLE